MSVYSIKGKGWRYDFTLKGERYTQAWYKTKTKAKQAEAEKRKEVTQNGSQTPIDMDFLQLVSRRLDHLASYNTEKHYIDYRYLARKWVEQWGQLKASDITPEMIERYTLDKTQVSHHAANKELRCLRSLFNFGKKKKLVLENPTDDLEFLPVEKKIKHVPSPKEIDKLIATAETEDFADYLWAVRETLARVSEINRLTWDDVNFRDRHVVLYTRKKRGGHLTPRKIPMTEKLFEVLSRRHAERDPSKPWVFWHSYWNNKSGERVEGPYKNRRKALKALCEKIGVKYSGFHALRHSGASIMEHSNVPVGDIQKLLGHENRSTTEIYLHTLGDSQRRAIETYEQARQTDPHTDPHTDSAAA